MPTLFIDRYIKSNSTKTIEITKDDIQRNSGLQFLKQNNLQIVSLYKCEPQFDVKNLPKTAISTGCRWKSFQFFNVVIYAIAAMKYEMKHLNS